MSTAANPQNTITDYNVANDTLSLFAGITVTMISSKPIPELVRKHWIQGTVIQIGTVAKAKISVI
ncbi:hypothetical protein [Nitrosomonas ureae]|uniref:hypothetical protein n=1 Tax=Nitrosomonas ureae TaxID=44577 RepID=UPI000BE23192|nr:hypothetical protein [Nitrosomonas ureae]